MKFFFIFFIIFLSYTNLFGNFLDKKMPEIKEISKTTYEETATRKKEDVVLYGKNIGNIKFSISYPKVIKKDDRIAIFLDGLVTGKNVLKVVRDVENLIIIGYEFPKKLVRFTKRTQLLLHPFSIRKAALNVPFQILGIVKWLQGQNWYIDQKTDIVGVSFGAFFVPAIYHLAQKNNINLGLAVIAYGGADIYNIFYHNLKEHKILRVPLAYFAYFMFREIDPERHLPYIKGKFLVINGTLDKNIPASSRKKLQDLTPEPKTIINLKTKHIQPREEDLPLINKIIDIGLKWIDENK